MKSKTDKTAPALPISNIARIVRFGSFMGFVPYKWNETERQIQVRPGRVWKVTSLCWSTVMAVYGAFLVYGFLRTSVSEDTSTFVKFRVLYMNLAYLILDVGVILNLQSYGEHHYVFNQLVKTSREFQGLFGNLGVRTNTLKWVARVIAWGYIFGCSNAMAVFLSPQSPRLLTSLLAEPKKAHKAIKVSLFIVHLLINACNFYFLAFNALMLMLYVYVTAPLVGVFRWRPASPKTLTDFTATTKALSVQIVQKYYTALLVLQSAYTQTYGPWVLLIMVWCNIIATMNVFQSVVFENIRAFIMTLMVCFLMSRATKTAAKVYEIDKQVHQSWTAVQNPDWFLKFRQACRPVRIPLGNFFFFDRGIMLTFLNIIVTNAANLIVSYKQNKESLPSDEY